MCDIARLDLGAWIQEIFITINVPEAEHFISYGLPLKVIRNPSPKGFGENHNNAFKLASGEYFCVVNPDIRLSKDPFPELFKAVESERTAIVAPFVLAPEQTREDSIRYFPTISNFFKKLINLSDGCYPIRSELEPFDIEWAAGMFLLFQSSEFKNIGGFDEKFFLYYEDVDICLRMWKAGRRVLACPQAAVTHDAQRASHKKLQYFRWHMSSLFRYFFKHWLRLPDIKLKATNGR